MKIPKASTVACVLAFACFIMSGRADDDSEEETDSSEEAAPQPDTTCPSCPSNPPRNYAVCGTNGMRYGTFSSYCYLVQYACLMQQNWVMVHEGPCVRRPPVVTPRVIPTTRRPPTTRRVITAALPEPRKTTPRPKTTTTAPPTTTTTTTEPITCPTTCDLVFEPVCTTVGTYQSECAFDSVRCRGIISSEESILYLGYCLEATTKAPSAYLA